MIPVSSLIIKNTSQNIEGLCKALKVYGTTASIVYSITIASEKYGTAITNRSLRSGDDVINYIDSFHKHGSLENATIIVSRELLAANDPCRYIRQPYITGINQSRSILQCPLFFIAGEAKRDDVAVTASHRDYLFISRKNTSDKYVDGSLKVNGDYFKSLTQPPNGDKLGSCFILGVFPKTKHSAFSIMIQNNQLLMRDNEFDLFFLPNGYGDLMKKTNTMVQQKDQEDIVVIEEKNDLSSVIKKPNPAPCGVGQIVQFNFLAGNVCHAFSHLYIVTYVNDTSEVVCMRKAFAGVSGDIVQKKYSDFKDEDIWVFNCMNK